MIQFNLLPDIKIEFIKAKRMKRLVAFVSVIVSSVCIGFFVILFLLVNVWQKQQMTNLEKETNEIADKIKNTEDIDKILTVQSQLKTIDGLHNAKPIASKFFQYIEAVKPANSSITNRTLSVVDNKVTLSGTASSLEVARQFVDTLKYSEYKINENDEAKKAFTSVELSSFSLSTAEENPAIFTIRFAIDPVIISSAASNLSLKVIRDPNLGEVDIIETPSAQTPASGGTN